MGPQSRQRHSGDSIAHRDGVGAEVEEKAEPKALAEPIAEQLERV
ncbi:MAG TPA: hypothetical protein VFT19_07125 [Solirubrobacterales bacterium]|nr:hypothetical protein [Solirubrobacterales bacterium]